MLQHVNFFGGTPSEHPQECRTTPHSRAEIVRRVILEGQPPGAVAAAFGVCLKTVGKWVTRFKAGGLEALAEPATFPRRMVAATCWRRIMPNPCSARPSVRASVSRRACRAHAHPAQVLLGSRASQASRAPRSACVRRWRACASSPTPKPACASAASR
ncbi:MAG: helix-turn-helix domain-containing protein [Alphaproteobacteria bacterium]|nr:helix-turn-helix domain-containing protein [Alphaproteobacteria bacterium]